MKNAASTQAVDKTGKILRCCLKSPLHSNDVRDIKSRPIGPGIVMWWICRLVHSVLLIVLSSVFFPSLGKAQGYKVGGTLDASYFVNGTLTKERHTHFDIRVNECAFNVRTFLSGGTNYYEWGSDGRDLYRILIAPASYEGMHKTPTNNVPYAAYISTLNSLPLDDGSLNQYVWLAYASQCFLLSSTNGILEPMWQMDDPSLKTNHFSMAAQIETNASGLPSRVVYMNDGFYRGIDPETKQQIKRQLPPPYNKGFTNAIYECISWRPVDKIVIPDQFRFTLFRTPLGIQGSLQPRLIVNGFTTTVESYSGGPDFKPTFNGRGSVWDYRATGSIQITATSNITYSYIGYVTTNGGWLTSNQLGKAILQHDSYERHQYIEQKSDQPSAQQRVSYGTLAVMIIVSLVFLFAAWKSVAMKQSK